MGAHNTPKKPKLELEMPVCMHFLGVSLFWNPGSMPAINIKQFSSSHQSHVAKNRALVISFFASMNVRMPWKLYVTTIPAKSPVKFSQFHSSFSLFHSYIMITLLSRVYSRVRPVGGGRGRGGREHDQWERKNNQTSYRERIFSLFTVLIN